MQPILDFLQNLFFELSHNFQNSRTYTNIYSCKNSITQDRKHLLQDFYTLYIYIYIFVITTIYHLHTTRHSKKNSSVEMTQKVLPFEPKWIMKVVVCFFFCIALSTNNYYKNL